MRSFHIADARRDPQMQRARVFFGAEEGRVGNMRPSPATVSDAGADRPNSISDSAASAADHTLNLSARIHVARRAWNSRDNE